jgi:hypothetical protein
MTAKVTVPNIFANQTTAIPLAQLDSNFTQVSGAINNAATYSNYADDIGTANNYFINISGVTTTYVAGIRFQFKAANANTNSCSLDVNSQGSKGITKPDGTDLDPYTIVAGQIVDVIYNGTTFQMVNIDTLAFEVSSIVSSATITPPSDLVTQYNVTALAVPATVAIPSGTPADGQKLIIRIKDNGSSQALTWDTGAGGYREVGVTLPTVTIPSKILYVGCIYNSSDTFWDVVGVAQQV